jgi:hypothetical protein
MKKKTISTYLSTICLLNFTFKHGGSMAGMVSACMHPFQIRCSAVLTPPVTNTKKKTPFPLPICCTQKNSYHLTICSLLYSRRSIPFRLQLKKGKTSTEFRRGCYDFGLLSKLSLRCIPRYVWGAISGPFGRRSAACSQPYISEDYSVHTVYSK